MAVIKYLPRPKEVDAGPVDPKRIRLTYDMIMAVPQEVHISDSFATWLVSPAVEPNIRRLFTGCFKANSPEANGALLQLKVTSKGTDVASNFYALRRGGEPLISFLPDSKYKEAKGDEWARSSRQTAKPGRFLHMMFTDEALKSYGIDDPAIERFTNQVKAYVDLRLRLELVAGDEIEYWYAGGRYSPKGGANLQKSCMRDDNLSVAKFDFYTKNPNVRLLVCLDTEYLLLGRALVWTNVVAHEIDSYGKPKSRTPMHITYMDRVYAGEDFVEEAFRNYAQEQGWYYREFPKYERQLEAKTPSGKSINLHMKVPTGMFGPISDYPYVDTFKWMSRDFHYAFNYTPTSVKVGEVGSSWSIKPGVTPEGDVMTELHGLVPAAHVTRCRECQRTGQFDRMMALSFAIAPAQERICEECASAKYTKSRLMGGYIKAADSAMVEGADGRVDAVPKDMAVKSTFHKKVVLKALARYLPLYDDYVLRKAPIVPSRYHGSFVFKDDAVWMAELDSFVHKDHIAEIQRRIKEEGLDAAAVKVMHQERLSTRTTVSATGEDGAAGPGTFREEVAPLEGSSALAEDMLEDVPI